MADDWQPGDTALCIKSCPYTQSGCKYVVTSVSRPGDINEGFQHHNPEPFGLRFSGISFRRGDWCAGRRFTKLRPHTPDAEDAETIRLLTGAPAKEPVP